MRQQMRRLLRRHPLLRGKHLLRRQTALPGWMLFAPKQRNRRPAFSRNSARELVTAAAEAVADPSSSGNAAHVGVLGAQSPAQAVVVIDLND